MAKLGEAVLEGAPLPDGYEELERGLIAGLD
jgi:hypothetical protein